MIKISRAYLLHRVLEIKEEDVEVIVTHSFLTVPTKSKAFNQRTPILGILGTVQGEINLKTENWDGGTTLPLLQMHASKPGLEDSFLQKLFSPKEKTLTD